MKKINWAQNDLSETPEPSSGPLLKSCHTRVTGGSETQSVFTELHSFCGRANCFLVSVTACVCVCVLNPDVKSCFYTALQTPVRAEQPQDPGIKSQSLTINYRLPKTTLTHAGGSVWISSLVKKKTLLEINQREDRESNSGTLCLLLLRLLIDNNILRTLAAIPSHLPRTLSDKVAGCVCVCAHKCV